LSLLVIIFVVVERSFASSIDVDNVPGNYLHIVFVRSTPGRVDVKWLLLGWATVCGH